jgi:hypothetical protein
LAAAADKNGPTARTVRTISINLVSQSWPVNAMARTEHTINDALAELLRGTRRAWRDEKVVTSEDTGQLKDTSGRPDILVIEPNVCPVVIETEFFPATTVEAEALSRLGAQVRTTGKRILSSVAARLPDRLREKYGNALGKDLASAVDLEMALYTGSAPSDATRWPTSGWMVGTVADLSSLTQAASVPPDVIEQAVSNLVGGVGEAAGILIEIAKGNSEAIKQISKELFQEDGVQTRRMAATILANAFVFHESLAGKIPNISSIDELRGKKKFNKATVLKEWEKILAVNYWPIFHIAKRILEHVPVGESKQLIDRLAETADRLLENQLMRSHDLTGAVFQRMIVDRKFLAAYYTTPASAALLIGLALSPEGTPADTSWAKPDDVKALRIADFACGTGTLLTTAYQRIGQLHELAGGNSEAIHAEMMAHAIIGCDVLPAAAHLTASMISGSHPTVKYEQSSILTVAYGKQPDGGLALGSLDLLNPQRKFEILAVTAKAAEGMGEKERETWAALPHASFDLVVMNPPFTRPTNHEGSRHDVPNPMFAAFSSSAEEQKLMSEATKRLTVGTSAHGNAGEASIFLVLADRKVKQGGTVALVMPLSLMLGESWEDSRALLARYYSDMVVVSIAGATDEDSSFSADTDMAECLVVARKRRSETERATFVVLVQRPAYPLLGASASEQIRRLLAGKKIRRLEDGPMGGTSLYFGDDVIGHAMEAPVLETAGWNLARVADLSLAQAAYQLATEQKVWLPTMGKSDTVAVPVTTLAKIGQTGPIDRDIDGINPDRTMRGPFDVVPVHAGAVPTYPVLWSHDADRERAMCFEADCEGVPRQGAAPVESDTLAARLESVWATASHCHFNINFRFNSQSTGMQFTPLKTIGGRAWQSIKLASVEQEKALVAWANTSLGMLLRWWHSNKQQAGRGNVGKTAMQSMPIMDVTALTPGQLRKAANLFDDICEKPLLPLHELVRDVVRRELDERFAREVLGWSESIIQPGGPLELLRMKLAQEPSIRGNK